MPCINNSRAFARQQIYFYFLDAQVQRDWLPKDQAKRSIVKVLGTEKLHIIIREESYLAQIFREYSIKDGIQKKYYRCIQRMEFEKSKNQYIQVTLTILKGSK